MLDFIWPKIVWTSADSDYRRATVLTFSSTSVIMTHQLVKHNLHYLNPNLVLT